MTIDIPDTIAQDIVAVFGQVIAKAHQQTTADLYRNRANVFIQALEPASQDSHRWLLDETVKIWSGGR